jgi:hypothetical protein
MVPDRVRTRVVSNDELFRKVMASDAAIELKDLNEMTFLVDLMRITRIDSATPPTAALVAPPWNQVSHTLQAYVPNRILKFALADAGRFC